MKAHGFALRWPLIVLAVLAAHSVLLPFIATHIGFSTTAAATLLAILVLKHVGVLAPLWADLKRRSRKH